MYHICTTHMAIFTVSALRVCHLPCHAVACVARALGSTLQALKLLQRMVLGNRTAADETLAFVAAQIVGGDTSICKEYAPGG